MVRDEAPIRELMIRVRNGDPQAAAELVRLYEPLIRQRVRIGLRMQDERLGRILDSMDICQSVLASFFLRVAAGQYELDEPGQLLALLTRMARNKLAHHVVEHQARRRDLRREDQGDADHVVDPRAGPERSVIGRDLLEAVRARLGAEERRLADRRGEGRSWVEIAAEVGGTGEGRRKQLARALNRVLAELGLDETPEEWLV